jgi:hypothetical protein
MREHKWQKATEAQVSKCVAWCQNELQLRDWQIDIVVGQDRPPETADKDDRSDDVVYGAMAASPNRLKAIVFVHDVNCNKENENMYLTAIHEMLHVMLYANGIHHDLQEPLARRFESIVYRLFCKENGLKITPEKLGY